MNISEAKLIRIVGYLQQLGYSPVRVRYNQYWYLSPFRQEQTPSFKVNDQRNEWYDFGMAAGGDLVELGKYLYGTKDIPTVLRKIGKQARATPGKYIHPANPSLEHAQEGMKDIIPQPLRHNALLSYMRSRCIDEEVARKMCQEIHYTLRNKKYFAIGFRNRSDGYEIRNPYFKGCLFNKDITFIHHYGYVIPHVCVFEGFMDFLSYLTFCKKQDKTIIIDGEQDFIVLNSVSCLRKCLEELESYAHIHCFFDNDLAGKKTFETIQGLYGDKAIDESARYHGYKDLNDYLRGKPF